MVGIGDCGREYPGVQRPLGITEPLGFHVLCLSSRMHGSHTNTAFSHVPHLILTQKDKVEIAPIYADGDCQMRFVLYSQPWPVCEVEMGNLSPFLLMSFAIAGAMVGLCL